MNRLKYSLPLTKSMRVICKSVSLSSFKIPATKYWYWDHLEVIYWCENYSGDVSYISRSEKKFETGIRRLFFFRLNSPSSPSLSSYVRCLTSSWPFAGFAPVCPCLSCPEGLRLYPTLQMSVTSAEQSRRITFLILLAMLSLMQPRRLLAFAVVALCWLMVKFISLGLSGPSLLFSWLPCSSLVLLVLIQPDSTWSFLGLNIPQRSWFHTQLKASWLFNLAKVGV